MAHDPTMAVPAWVAADELRSSCAYGVPRAQCHVGCGRTCRRLKDPKPPCCGGCDKPAGHAPCQALAPGYVVSGNGPQSWRRKQVGYIGSDRPPGVGPDHA